MAYKQLSQEDINESLDREIDALLKEEEIEDMQDDRSAQPPAFAPESDEAANSASAPLPATSDDISLVANASGGDETRISFHEIDGVFSNMAVKPTDITAGKIYEEIEPPSYHEAVVDPSPDYFINCVDETGEVLIEGLPMGNYFLFFVNMFISMTFDVLGFFLTTMMATSHAARLGAQSGLGLTLIRYGVLLKSRADGPIEADPFGDERYRDPEEEKSRRQCKSRHFLLEQIENQAPIQDYPYAKLDAFTSYYHEEAKKDGAEKQPSKLGKEIVARLVKTWSVNQDIALQLYWLVEKEKTKTMLLQGVAATGSSGLLTEDDVDELYHQLESFYLQERIASLDLVSAIFRASQDQGHAFYGTAQKVVDGWMEQGDFQTKVLKKFQKTMETLLDPSLEHFSEKAAQWTRQNLKEQKAFLEILIMVHYTVLPDPQDSVQVLETLMDLELGLKQTNRPFFDRMGLELSQQVEDLACILFTEVLNLEVVLDRIDAPHSSLSEALFDRPDLIESINKSVWECIENSRSYQDVTGLGVVAIAWACYIQFLLMNLTRHCPDAYKELFAVLSNNHPEARSTQRLFQFGYQQAAAIDYIGRLVEPASFIHQDSNEIAYKSILKGLLNMILATQNVSTLPGRPRLVRVFADLFSGSTALVSQFWTRDFSSASGGSLLEATQRAFPASFSDFMTLLESLVAGPDSADYLVQYLSTLPSICDFARGSDYEPSFEQEQGLSVWHWKGTSLIQGAPNFAVCPPLYTPAYEVGSEILLLNYSYSAWHLFLSYLDSFLHSSNLEGDVHVGSAHTSTAILKLFNKVLQFGDANTYQELFAHLATADGNFQEYAESPVEILPGLIGEIMNRCSTSKTPMLGVISECLQSIRYLLPHYPEVTWKRLRASTLFPQYVYSIGNAGYFQSFVLPLECSSGTYSTTISFLSLVKHLALEAQKLNVASRLEKDVAPAGILYSCLLFILRDVFSTYGSWRFVHIHEKFQLTLLVLEILNCIIDDTTWYHYEHGLEATDSSVRLSMSHKLLLDTYVFHATNYQLSPLLDVIALGGSGPLLYYASGKKKEARLLELAMAEALKLLKSFLLVLTQYNHASALESALLDRTITTSTGPVEFIQIIASLIDYQNNSSFAQLATENLTLLCILSKRPGRPATFFVGYFGAEAFTLVSQFIDLVRIGSHRAKVASDIQTSVYSFIAAVVDSQPGLGAMFLSGYEPKSLTSHNTLDTKDVIPESSVLSPVLQVLKDWRRLRTNSASVLSACLSLLDTLWQSATEHQTTIKLLRSQQDLWNSLLEILTEKIAPASEISSQDCTSYCHFLTTQAHVLRLLSIEVYLNFKHPSSVVNQEMSKRITATLVEYLFARSTPVGQDRLVHNPEYTEVLLELSSSLEVPIPFDGYRRINWDEQVDSGKKYGTEFIYNVSLLERKSDLVMDAETIRLYEQIFNQVRVVNLDWSLTDVQLVMVKAASFAVKTLMASSKPAASPVSKSLPTSIPFASLEKLLYVVLRNLQAQTTQHFVHISYKTELSTLLVHLVNQWTSNCQDHYQEEQCRGELIKLLDMLQRSLMIPQFPIGPAGSFSAFPFHFHILSCMLLLLSKAATFSPPTAVWRKRFDTAYQSIIPTLCHGLCSLFSGPSSPESRDEESLVTSLMLEMLRPDSGASTSVWLPCFEKYQILPVLMNAFSTWQLHSKQNLCGFPEKALQLILSMSCYPSSASLLASGGVVASFCNNNFTRELLEGHATPYDGMEMKLTHRVWCLMLSIIANLVTFLQGDGHFLESVIGFLRLYHGQIVFSLYNNDPLTLASLVEIERISGLYCRVSESLELRRTRLTVAQAETMLEIPILNEFQGFALQILADYVYLFKNPHDLGNRIQPISRQERIQVEQPGPTGAATPTSSVFRGEIDRRM
ncbi:hypothetical protein HDU91_005460, partial [Kappamyces sp. JEL0680]